MLNASGHVIKAACTILPSVPSLLSSSSSQLAVSSSSPSTVTFDIEIDGGGNAAFSSKDLIPAAEGGGGGSHVSSILLHVSHLAAAATASAAASAASEASAPSFQSAVSLSRSAQMTGAWGGWPLGILVSTCTAPLMLIMIFRIECACSAGAAVVYSGGSGKKCDGFCECGCGLRQQRRPVPLYNSFPARCLFTGHIARAAAAAPPSTPPTAHRSSSFVRLLRFMGGAGD